MRQKSLFGESEQTKSFDEAFKFLDDKRVIAIAWKGHEEVLSEFGHRFKEEQAFKNLRPEERAQFVHRQVVERMKALMTTHCPVMGELCYAWRREQNMDILSVDGRFLLCFKKLRDDLSRSNYPTQKNKEFWSQESSGRPLKLIIGYRPNAQWSAGRLYLTLPSRNRVAEWRLIEDQTAAIINLQLSSKEQQQPAVDDTEPMFKTKPKNVAATGSRRRNDGRVG